jgi:hypothetical protein
MNSLLILLAAFSILVLASSSSRRSEGLTALSAAEAVNVVVRDGNSKVVYNTAKNRQGARFAQLGAGVTCTRNESVGDAVQFGDYRDAVKELATLKQLLQSAESTYQGTQANISSLEKEIAELRKP